MHSSDLASPLRRARAMSTGTAPTGLCRGVVCPALRASDLPLSSSWLRLSLPLLGPWPWPSCLTWSVPRFLTVRLQDSYRSSQISHAYP